jgi:hypothetical protein
LERIMSLLLTSLVPPQLVASILTGSREDNDGIPRAVFFGGDLALSQFNGNSAPLDNTVEDLVAEFSGSADPGTNQSNIDPDVVITAAGSTITTAPVGSQQLIYGVMGTVDVNSGGGSGIHGKLTFNGSSLRDTTQRSEYAQIDMAQNDTGWFVWLFSDKRQDGVRVLRPMYVQKDFPAPTNEVDITAVYAGGIVASTIKLWYLKSGGFRKDLVVDVFQEATGRGQLAPRADAARAFAQNSIDERAPAAAVKQKLSMRERLLGRVD